MNETEPPKRTGKPPEWVSLTGLLIAWGEDNQPVLIGVTGSPLYHLSCFSSEDGLRSMLSRVGASFTKIKRIDDGPEFLASIPKEVVVVVAPHFVGERFRYAQVLR
jgi:hypothetical protein